MNTVINPTHYRHAAHSPWLPGQEAGGRVRGHLPDRPPGGRGQLRLRRGERGRKRGEHHRHQLNYF